MLDITQHLAQECLRCKQRCGKREREKETFGRRIPSELQSLQPCQDPAESELCVCNIHPNAADEFNHREAWSTFHIGNNQSL